MKKQSIVYKENNLCLKYNQNALMSDMKLKYTQIRRLNINFNIKL